MTNFYSILRNNLNVIRNRNSFIKIISLMLLLQVFIFSAKAQDITKTYTSDGTFVVPQGVTEITVEAWGAGGGGGNRTSRGEAGGGGGGAYAKSVLIVEPEVSYNIVVGKGGNSGTNGGDSTFGGDMVVAKGGKSVLDDDGNGAAGGSAAYSIGDVVYSGGNGGNAGKTGEWWPTSYSGGGGGAAGSTGNGKSASGQTGGAATEEHGGAGADGVTNNSDGNNGSDYGGGGSGAKSGWGGNSDGGTGADGFIRISYVPPFQAEFGTVDVGSSIWEFGETRTVSVTVTNTGQAVWNAENGVQLGVKWDGGTYQYVDGNGLEMGETGTFIFSVTAPEQQVTTNLTFGIFSSVGDFENNEVQSSELTIVPSVNTFYSYKTGDWGELSTWTHDPSGTTHICESLPEEYSEVNILSGRVVRFTNDIDIANLQLTINEGGVLDISTYKFISGLYSLKGQGTLKIASAYFPAVSNVNTFVEANGGTTEFYNITDFQMPQSQSIYNNLVINTSGARATQRNNITLNGNLYIKSGTYRINNNSATNRLSLDINGDVIVDENGFITVGEGNTVTNDTDGGTAPFIDYYNNNSHRVVVKGDFTNNGTVRFTNQAAPHFSSFPSNGFATVYFMGASDNVLYANGQTDFYNLVLDKGSDQTYKLTVQSTAYSNFRLFGRNDLGGEGGGANPNLRKALWLRTGTMVLDGLIVIPTLTEASTDGSPNGDFYIPANAALELRGPEVIVLTTADSYQEINAAYGTSLGSGEAGVLASGGTQSLSVYGKLSITDGYLSTRESGGIITWDVASGQLEIGGGYLDAKQIRAAGGNNGLASYQQTGGTVALRGRFQRQPIQYNVPADLRAEGIATIETVPETGGLNGSMGTFNINDASNVFMMAGGKVQIFDACGDNGYAVDIFAGANNINVTGGTFEILPMDGDNDLIIRTNAPLGNFVVNRSGGGSKVVLGNNYPLTVLRNLSLINGEFNANDVDVTVGGNFTIATGGLYDSGSNTTLFNGADDQKFTISGTLDNGNTGLENLSINKSGGVLSLEGDNTDLTVQGDFDLTNGIFDDGGKTVLVEGNITNSGEHTGEGKIQLDGDGERTIGGNGNGIFENFTIDNNGGAKLTANTSINGVLTLSEDGLNIDIYNLYLGADASVAGVNDSRYIQSAGNAGDGGLTRKYNDAAEFTFPVGVENYTPATIGFSAAPTSYGTITVVPVNYPHPVASENGNLDYFWRVKSDGFAGYEGKVTHRFTYNQIDVNGTESNYIPVLYDAENYEWNKGATSDVDPGTNIISDWTSPGASADFIDGDYTAGVETAFSDPEKFYSRTTGLWNEPSTWSTTGHDGGAASRIPVEGDIVIIGEGHTVSLERYDDNPDRDVQNCASLQIEDGGVLDMTYNPASNFGMVLSHPNGNGLLRVSTAYSSGSTFEFPNGDFTEFNANLGTTELYTINSTAGTTYWLPNDVTSYGNLIISPVGGSNIIFGNTDVTIYGDLTTKGQNSESWFCPTWNEDYPTAPNDIMPKTIKIEGDMHLQGGALIFYGNEDIAQDFVIHGDVVVDEGAGVKIQSHQTGIWGWGTSTPNNQSISIGGSLINNASFGNDEHEYAGCDFTGIPVTFFGNTNAKITNTSGTPDTRFDEVTVNKGNSQATKLTIDIAGDLETPDDNWLTLQNGTLEFKRDNTNQDFTITTFSPFTIPSTAGLLVDYDKSNDARVLIGNDNSNNNDLFLNGKLTVVNGDVYVGAPNSPNNNNDIEYAGGGASAIEVQGGQLVVNGQVRRNPATTSGILSYSQSGGEVVINGRNANDTNAKLEVLNQGSEFNMSGGTLTIVRGGGGNSYGDLYLRPESSNVTGGDIVFNNEESGNPEQYVLDANIPLNNLTIMGQSDAQTTVKLLVSPLTLKGNLNISENSVFDANSGNNINLTINGNFINDGTYNHYENLTIFNGGEQSIDGLTATDFYDLKINSVTSVSLVRDVTVQNNLELTSGQLLVADHKVTVNGDLINNAAYINDVAFGGIVLSGGEEEHRISGTGAYGRLELNDGLGARLLNDVTLKNDFVLTNGVLNINQYLFTLDADANIQGNDFGSGKMISSDGVYSNQGMKKYFPENSAGTEFTYPLGIGNKYTPVLVKFTENNQAGAIRINAINAKHPSSVSPFRVLDYYWDVEHSGLDNFQGELDFHYSDDDVMQTEIDESDYIAARLNTTDYSWFKFSTDEVDEVENIIHLNIVSAANISGEYMAGIDENIPDEVPVYRSVADGSWSDVSIWQAVGDAPACSSNGPQGAIVIIDSEVTIDNNYRYAYKTTINDKLKVDKITYGHNLGKINGEGILYVEDALMPAGKYDDFLSCNNNSTLEFGGNDEYNIVADLFTSISNLKISGSGSRMLPAKTLSICNSLVIDGATLDNSVNNETLIIRGTMERYNGGRFVAGSGADATVSFAGDEEQMLGGGTGDFTGVNAFNNLEVNNASGLFINGAIEVAGTLMLTNGLINTSGNNSLTITNTSYNSVTPAGGHSGSYVNGPLIKRILQGGAFTFPVGKHGKLGSKLTVTATQSGTIDWSVEYFTPNDTYDQYSDPVTYVNSEEYWRVSASGGSKARIGINWDASSDVTPLITMNGLIDLLVANYDESINEWIYIESSANGENDYGTVVTDDRITISADGHMDFTTAIQNAVKAKAKLTPEGVLCGTEAGIPVTFTSSAPILLNYELKYTINGVEQEPVTVSSVPYILPTSQPGDYQLTGFTYNNGVGIGVVDDEVVTVYALPTEADAGDNQSICGGSSVVLEGNTPDVGIGLWTIVSGEGGSLVAPTSPTSNFSGTNGSTYILRWTISNGECTSSDEVTIAFPVLAAQPGEFTEYETEVCQGDENVIFTVPPDASIEIYEWDYSGNGVSIEGSENSVSLSFSASATSGTLSVKGKNDCGLSNPREIAITVNEAITGVTLESNIDGSLCVNNSPVFTAVPSETLTGLNYEFFVNGVSRQSGVNETFEPVNMANGDVVNVVATTTDGCSTTSNDITVSVVAIEGLWMGTEDSDWNNPANWCANIVPASGDITISGSSVFAPEISSDMVLTGLTIEENANFVVKPGVLMEITGDMVNNGKITLQSDADELAYLFLPDSPTKAGIANVKLTIPKDHYWYLSTPLKDVTDDVAKASWFGELNSDPMADDWVFVHRMYNGHKQWVRVEEELDLYEMEGVSVWYYDQDKVLDYEGVINTGIIMRTFEEKDFHLFGNPYPTAIDWENPAGWERYDFGNTIWSRVSYNGERTWQTYNNNGDDKPGVYALPPESFGQTEENVSYIPPYQTVWIKAEKENAKLTVSGETRVKDNSFGLKSSDNGDSYQMDIVRFTIQNSKALDGTVLYFSDGFLVGKSSEDSEKRFNDSKNIPEIYTRIDGKAYCINGMPQLSDPVYLFPLSVRNRINEETTITANLKRFKAGYEVFLEDKATGSWTNLKEVNEYVYTPVQMGDDHDRFVLHLEKVAEIPTSVEEPEHITGIEIIGQKELALVRIGQELLQTSDATIEVMDINGRLMNSIHTNEPETEVDLPDNSGVYVIRVSAGGVVETGKVFRSTGQ